ncbi:hypothetical protein [Thermophagus xiamenensis]|uniref:Uncharacterized protein n=1 Tax=Thermophagus xiamenensis TaxID=385682 RepID=A0A1I2CB41_9BACT|nr:hypothetical protein [Thermophagus xiamenensis]SFE65559.1 hypothetical protein SAMN05444380_11588 [Thermophagus xiamenensis]
MNTEQTNRLNMLESVNNYLDENAGKWQGISRLVAAKTELSQKIAAINAAAEAQANAQATYGKTKMALKKAIAAKADILNDVIEAYALTEGDDELARQMSDSQWELYRLPYNDFYIKVRSIIDKASELQEVLVSDFGLTTELITDVQNDLNQLLEIDGLPRAYQIKSSVATNEIEQLLSQASDLLYNQIDKLMSIFKHSDPNFYHGYQKARMIVD